MIHASWYELYSLQTLKVRNYTFSFSSLVCNRLAIKDIKYLNRYLKNYILESTHVIEGYVCVKGIFIALI